MIKPFMYLVAFTQRSADQWSDWQVLECLLEGRTHFMGFPTHELAKAESERDREAHAEEGIEREYQILRAELLLSDPETPRN